MKILFTLFTLLGCFIFVLPVLAVDPPAVDCSGPDCIDLTANIDSNFIDLVGLKPSNYLATGINLLFPISGIASLFYLVWGGIQWVQSGGDKDGVEKARKKITAALIGLAVALSAYALLGLIGTLFGVDNLLKLDIKPLIEGGVN